MALSNLADWMENKTASPFGAACAGSIQIPVSKFDRVFQPHIRLFTHGSQE